MKSTSHRLSARLSTSLRYAGASAPNSRVGLGRVPDRRDPEALRPRLAEVCLVGHHHHEVRHVFSSSVRPGSSLADAAISGPSAAHRPGCRPRSAGRRPRRSGPPGRRRRPSRGRGRPVLVDPQRVDPSARARPTPPASRTPGHRGRDVQAGHGVHDPGVGGEVPDGGAARRLGHDVAGGLAEVLPDQQLHRAPPETGVHQLGDPVTRRPRVDLDQLRAVPGVLELDVRDAQVEADGLGARPPRPPPARAGRRRAAPSGSCARARRTGCGRRGLVGHAEHADRARLGQHLDADLEPDEALLDEHLGRAGLAAAVGRRGADRA